ncbi:MAG TPA: PAS domain S-box protein [Noviherbaspirillum sp.]|uniref:PAS domain S-box protein n=1 Tax=Noviherbaspirillum sp. TaxID=1926288 RepID=UPI002DDCD811|nr:PAS domain S-box protein [Noviherbaspirillum sp.]HEV2612083.1 PAS domain S-box protein [Noviherbaspirillum sp.]
MCSRLQIGLQLSLQLVRHLTPPIRSADNSSAATSLLNALDGTPLLPNCYPPDLSERHELPGENSYAQKMKSLQFDSVLFESSPDCVKLLDLGGHILAMNRNGRCVMQIDDFCLVSNLHWAALWPEQSHAAIHAALDAARNGEQGHFNAFCPTAKGTPKWWNVIVTPVRAANGEIQRFLAVSRDVTTEHLAREELRESRERFALLLESSVEGIYGMAQDKTCTFMNRAGAAILGYAPEELIGKPLHHLIHHHHSDGSYYPEEECRLAKAVAEGVPVRIEDEVFWRKDGSPVDVSYSVAPIIQEGARAGAVVTFTDVTQRRRTEKALQASEERLRLATGAAKVGIWVWDVKEDRMTWESELLYDIFGVPKSEKAINVARFLSDMLHPEDVEPYSRALRQTAECGARLHYEGRFHRLTTRELRWVEFTGLPYRVVDGRPVSIIGTAADITDRKLAEVALHESTERLEKILSQAVTGVVQVDAAGRVTLVNKRYCDMLGCTEAELIGVSVEDVTAPDSIKETRDAIERLAAGGPGFVIDKQYRRKDGSYLWATSSVNALRSEDGQYQGFVAIVVDITERKLAEAKLRDADRRKDEFLAMLAHELRNPLAPISAAAQLLQMARMNETRVLQTSEIIARQVEHMTSLVDDLLDVSRVTRGLVELDNAPLEIRQVIADAVEQVTPVIQARRHHLMLHLAPETTIVMGDQKRLVQVIANLVNNSAKYTHEGGNILVKTEVREAHVLLEVTDDGIGMEPGLVARVFDLFAQAEVTSDRSSGGLGLGLALVRSLVELHGGTVKCESAGIGKGSTFTICLPRLVASPKPHTTRRPRRLMDNETNSLRVLVVDDNVDAAVMLTMLLESAGHEVFVEHGSKRALERAKAESPDVCLLDIGLPEMDGNELAQRLRAQPETADSVLIAVTGYGQESDRKYALAAGFDHHLVKPVDTNKLGEILKDVSTSRRTLHAS